MGTPSDMLVNIKKRTIPIKKMERMSPEETEGMIPVGKFMDCEKEDLYSRYDRMRKRAKNE